MNKRSILLILVFFSFYAVGQTQATQATTTKGENLKKLMEHCANHDLFNGAILVAENGKVIYRNAFGFADQIAEEKLTTEHAFYLASVSKQFTTTGIMILKEQGKLSYDDPLSKYFPDFPEYADKVTIRHMMTHTSGIPDHYRLGLYKPKLSNEDVLKRLVQVEQLDFEPGEKYSYSNGGFVLLSMIASKAAGMPFSKFMEKSVFTPLKMSRTLVYDNSEPKVEQRAKGHAPNGVLDDYEILTTGAGGMFSTIDDLLKWDQGLYSDKIIAQKSLSEAYLKTTLNDGSISDYGYGWSILEEDGQKVVQHSGGMNGYRTFIRRDLAKKQVHILLTNFGNGAAMGGINDAIAKILSGEVYELPKVRTSTILAQLIEKNPTQHAISRTNEMLTKDELDVDEMGINALGYNYLNQKQYGRAIAVFQFNIDQFPSSFNAFDSMGEAHMLSGDTTQAIKFYKKSIELNPNNTGGMDMLKSMGVKVDDLKKDIVVSNEVLDTYVGKYELGPGFILSILREGNQLKIHPTGQQISDIFPSSKIRFYSKIVDAQLTFNVDSGGEVKSLTLHQGGDQEAKRID